MSATDKPGSLSITRSEGQGVWIGPDIVLALEWSRHGQARLIIKAPRSVKILRTELGRPEPTVEGNEDD
jgi:sRNA-binding carbon storage regulator CsrA